MEGNGAAFPPANKTVFLSYRHFDNVPPPENRNARYVDYFQQQLEWQFINIGIPNTVVWKDRNKIAPGDIWNNVLEKALRECDLFIALISENYISGPWCTKELSVMEERLQISTADDSKGRIFRVDKYPVPDNNIPSILKVVERVKLYESGQGSREIIEYYYRGRVLDPQYFDVIKELAVAIKDRLEQLGVEIGPSTKPRKVQEPNNGRTIFVAKPAIDMFQEYGNITRELEQCGYNVAPKQKDALSLSGDEAQTTIQQALSKSECSIHLLGDLQGFTPDGLLAPIVAFQLELAAKEAESRSSFQRLIWVPKIVPSQTIETPEPRVRKSFEVLKRFGRFVGSDVVESDTHARFAQFVFDRLSIKKSKPKTIYVHYVGNDRRFALTVGKQLKTEGYWPVFRSDPAEKIPDDELLAQIDGANQTIICWSEVKWPSIVKALHDPIILKWRANDPDRRTIWLFVGGSSTDKKDEIIQFGYGGKFEKVVDIRSSGANT